MAIKYKRTQAPGTWFYTYNSTMMTAAANYLNLLNAGTDQAAITQAEDTLYGILVTTSTPSVDENGNKYNSLIASESNYYSTTPYAVINGLSINGFRITKKKVLEILVVERTTNETAPPWDTEPPPAVINPTKIESTDSEYPKVKSTEQSSQLTESQKVREMALITSGIQNAEDKKDPVIGDPSGSVAPNGKHYSKSDISYVIQTEGKTYSEALVLLSKQEKYRATGDTQPSKDNDAGITSNDIGQPANDTSAGTGINLSSGSDQARNAELAKQHPERVVNGVYYADDAALAKAKAAEEERIKQETAAATAQATAEAEKLASAMKSIQKALYGDNEEVIEQLSGSIGGVELNAVLGDAQSVRQRQRILDYNKFLGDYKEPSSGKPPNNKDQFPVDQKIKEFEAHQPTIKIQQVVTHNHGLAATIAAMSTSDLAEKRIVHLENNMATVLRYLFRIAARMHVNCLYWGGTSQFEKYKCIRCLNMDRVSDGQLMSLDQCLTCTRFEPVFGQVYEIKLVRNT